MRYLARRPSPVTICPCSRATKSVWNGKRRSVPAGLRDDDFRTLHDGLKAAADGLDFGQFGHGQAFTLEGGVIAPLRRARYGPP